MINIIVEKFDDNVLWPGKICYSLRYMYDQPDTDIHNRVQRRH